MVRNVVLTQSLHEQMASSIISTEQEAPSPRPAQNPTPQAKLDGSAPAMQICGNDAYTKSLMTKIAMGQATAEEQAAFQKHIGQARSLPSIQNLLHQQTPAPQAEIKPHRDDAHYKRQLEMLVAAGERARAAMAGDDYVEEEEAEEDEYDEGVDFDEEARQRRMEDLRAYQQQLKNLDAQNKRMKQKALEEQAKDSDVDRRRTILIQEEKKRLGPGGAHLRTRLFDKPARDLTPDERREFERLWVNEAQRFKPATADNAAKYTKPFCDFLTDNPTVFHCVAAMKKQLLDAGWTQLSERDSWDLKPSESYFIERNGSSLIAFVVGAGYEPGNGAAILAGHVDALTAKLKPISQVPNKAGYLQLGVAPYAGGLGRTWWDRDLGIGGRVHIRQGDKIVTKLVKLDWPIAKIPSLAEHFGAPAAQPFVTPNKETQMVPIIGLETSNPTMARPSQSADPFAHPSLLNSAYGSVGSFVHTQPPALVKAISKALGLEQSAADIVNWELELFDVQPATVAGLNKEFISAGRIDDKLCSWAAFQAILDSEVNDTRHSSIIKVVGLFDDEEIGSLLRQGAKGNFLPVTLERAVGSLAGHHPSSDLMGRTYANSFMVSSDVTHAVNPNFLGQYLENHAPHLNVGVAIAADSNGHMTTDSVSTTILKRCADKVDAKLQVFQIRNDSRSGGTVGPMLSSALGIRAVDAGLAQLSMHSIRATCGALDPGLGVLLFSGFLNGFEGVDKEMQD